MDEYYIPPTINELVAALQKLIKDPKNSINGEENIIDAFLVTEFDNSNFPPCSVGLSIRRTGLEDGKVEIGTLYIPPSRPKKLM